MHDGPWIYIGERVARYGPFEDVVEFGGRNFNGTIKDHFPDTNYTSLDIEPGNGVDIVANAATWRTDVKYDAVVCCEVFEHTPQIAAIIESAYEALKPKGYLLATCAIDPRAPHGSDGDEVKRGEYYANPDPGHLVQLLARHFEAIDVRLDRRYGDFYSTSVKGPGNL